MLVGFGLHARVVSMPASRGVDVDWDWSPS